MRPTLLHADVDAFYASVAQREEPALRGLPVIVGSWVVMAASYEARAYGVRGGMPTARARRQCPDAVVVDPSFADYTRASRGLFEIFRRYAPVVQAGSMEEAFLDVSDAGVPGCVLAMALRRDVREELDLPLSVGVAGTRVLAKIASREAKPDGLFVVPAEHELDFLHRLPVERLYGVGPATTARLHARGLRRVGQVADLAEVELMAILGKAAGRYVHAVAHAREPRRGERRRGRGSFGAQRALRRGPHPRPELEAVITDLAERLGRRMTRTRWAGRTVVLRLRLDDYTRSTRSRTLAHPTAEPHAIAAAARELLAAALPLIASNGITLVGLTVTNLASRSEGDQLALPFADPG